MTSPFIDPGEPDDPTAGPKPQFLSAQSNVLCADCGLSLAFAVVADIKVAACSSCHGMLIQREHLWPIIEGVRQATPEPDKVTPQPMDPNELQQRTDCPVCGQTMETFPYAGPSCVVIDNCDGCAVTWLNGGELIRIATAPGK